MIFSVKATVMLVNASNASKVTMLIANQDYVFRFLLTVSTLITLKINAQNALMDMFWTLSIHVTKKLLCPHQIALNSLTINVSNVTMDTILHQTIYVLSFLQTAKLLIQREFVQIAKMDISWPAIKFVLPFLRIAPKSMIKVNASNVRMTTIYHVITHV